MLLLSLLTVVYHSGNWGVDLQAGSQFGYRLLFVVLLAGLFAVFLQVRLIDVDYSSVNEWNISRSSPLGWVASQVSVSHRSTKRLVSIVQLGLGYVEYSLGFVAEVPVVSTSPLTSMSYVCRTHKRQWDIIITLPWRCLTSADGSAYILPNLNF